MKSMKLSKKEWVFTLSSFMILYFFSDPILQHIYNLIPQYTLDNPNLLNFLSLLFIIVFLKFIFPGIVVYYGLVRYFKKKLKKERNNV